MGQQIIKQPNGKIAVFSTITDTFVVADATPEEIIEWRASEAAEQARVSTKQELDRVLSEAPAYRQFTLSWDEATARDAEHGGGLFDDK